MFGFPLDGGTLCKSGELVFFCAAIGRLYNSEALNLGFDVGTIYNSAGELVRLVPVGTLYNSSPFGGIS